MSFLVVSLPQITGMHLFPQHIVEGLLNSRRRESDRPSWILISTTPARKSTDIAVVFFFGPSILYSILYRYSILSVPARAGRAGSRHRARQPGRTGIKNR